MIFVTGTDTGCGKTTVGRAIASALTARGAEVAVFKPVETGCEERDGQLIPADATALARAAGCELPMETICPYRFRMPASPERAASAENVDIDLSKITSAWDRLRRADRFVIVEGAGGLLVPLTGKIMMADLPSILDLPVLIVARDALGTVNHTLLTIEAVRARGLRLRGVVFSSTEAGASSLDNAQAIAAHGAVPLLGTLPFLPDADDATLARAAAEHLELKDLLGR